MFRITHELAQPIVDAMMRDVPYGINVMDSDGTIVASGTRSRIGSTHRGALHALSTGETVEIEHGSRNEKRGMNMPIIFGDDRVGVVGITGGPDQVRPFANLVRTSVTLLIRQHQNVEAATERERRQRELMGRLLRHEGSYAPELIGESARYGLDLHLPHVAVLVEAAAPFDLRSAVPGVAVLKASASAGIVLVSDEAEASSVIEAIARGSRDARFFVSNPEVSVRRGAEQVESAAGVASALTLTGRTIWFRDLAFLCALAKIDIPERVSISAALRSHDDLVATVHALVRHNGSMGKTATELCIHRNTLTYRLQRVEELTGRDPRNLLHVFELVHDLLRARAG